MKFQWIVLALALGAGLLTRYIMDQNESSPSESIVQSPTEHIDLKVLHSGKDTIDLFSPTDQRLRIVYFGYTHCPDVCPTSLAVLSAALQSLPQDNLTQLWPVFITLDPERDTPEKSAEYAGYFHATITGVSGSDAQIKALAEKYGVLYMRTEMKDSAMKYSVDHSSYFYLLQPDGTLIEKVPHTLNSAILVDAITRNLPQQLAAN
ncbi:SCO family protein [Photobacterium sanguinicancri]|uniref:SCO family protein n=1 Tax=Photobacterium sanguinicancri TaxID=875932 RepID=A0AAW7Y5N6_9GAMM|nr:SCO family protein [Photobacterium sanguinicancri]KXI24302.1 photosynthetic protein synthase I [Photobacterium sanguinicancri]MDO6542638.1 SCO family protein [Photobacterium sanguinicancri]OZS44595.1 SCO family protein [Photobacterium sanguinicancri]